MLGSGGWGVAGVGGGRAGPCGGEVVELVHAGHGMMVGLRRFVRYWVTAELCV